MPIQTNCICPRDTRVQAIAKINNNLVVLFQSMSADFTGRQIGVIGSGTGCGCSEIQALAILNDNIIEFAEVFSDGGGNPVDATITSWAELAAIETEDLSKPVIKIWVESATLSHKVTQIRAGTDATDTASGIQRPNDWASGTNEFVWYQS